MQNILYIGLGIYLLLNILSIKFPKITTITTILLPINYFIAFYIYKEISFYSMAVVFFVHFLLITLLSIAFIFTIYKNNRTTETIESSYGFNYTISKTRTYISLVSIILLSVINYATGEGIDYGELFISLLWVATIFFIGNSSYFYNIIIILVYLATLPYILNNKALSVYCIYLVLYEVVVTINYAFISYRNEREDKAN